MNWLRFPTWWVGGVVLALLCGSCAALRPEQSRTWETYTNLRYGFEFPYPTGWTATASVTNQDGQGFTDPTNAAVEIRGWASQASSVGGNDSGTQERSSPSPKQNFVTEQGLTGELRVQLGERTSSMTLILPQDAVTYYWQGRSPSDQFANYYQFFNYVATQYRIEE